MVKSDPFLISVNDKTGRSQLLEFSKRLDGRNIKERTGFVLKEETIESARGLPRTDGIDLHKGVEKEIKIFRKEFQKQMQKTWSGYIIQEKDKVVGVEPPYYKNLKNYYTNLNDLEKRTREGLWELDGWVLLCISIVIGIIISFYMIRYLPQNMDLLFNFIPYIVLIIVLTFLYVSESMSSRNIYLPILTKNQTIFSILLVLVLLFSSARIIKFSENVIDKNMLDIFLVTFVLFVLWTLFYRTLGILEKKKEENDIFADNEKGGKELLSQFIIVIFVWLMISIFLNQLVYSNQINSNDIAPYNMSFWFYFGIVPVTLSGGGLFLGYFRNYKTETDREFIILSGLIKSKLNVKNLPDSFVISKRQGFKRKGIEETLIEFGFEEEGDKYTYSKVQGIRITVKISSDSKKGNKWIVVLEKDGGKPSVQTPSEIPYEKTPSEKPLSKPSIDLTSVEELKDQVANWNISSQELVLSIDRFYFDMLKKVVISIVKDDKFRDNYIYLVNKWNNVGNKKGIHYNYYEGTNIFDKIKGNVGSLYCLSILMSSGEIQVFSDQKGYFKHIHDIYKQADYKHNFPTIDTQSLTNEEGDRIIRYYLIKKKS